MNKRTALALAALTACWPRVSDIKGPDGSQHVFIECKGSQGSCLEAAAERCPSGYKTVSAEGYDRGATVSASGLVATKMNRWSMFIKCR